MRRLKLIEKKVELLFILIKEQIKIILIEIIIVPSQTTILILAKKVLRNPKDEIHSNNTMLHESI